MLDQNYKAMNDSSRRVLAFFEAFTSLAAAVREEEGQLVVTIHLGEQTLSRAFERPEDLDAYGKEVLAGMVSTIVEHAWDASQAHEDRDEDTSMSVEVHDRTVARAIDGDLLAQWRDRERVASGGERDERMQVRMFGDITSLRPARTAVTQWSMPSPCSSVDEGPRRHLDPEGPSQLHDRPSHLRGPRAPEVGERLEARLEVLGGADLLPERHVTQA